MNTDLILQFSADLENHNSRDWFHAHQKEYQLAKNEFQVLLQFLILRLGELDSRVMFFRPQDVQFRVARDTRYSHDKSPYNPGFRAHIGPLGKRMIPTGFFMALRPGGRSCFAAGLFTTSIREATLLVRDHIVTCGDQLESIQHAMGRNGLFIQGEKLKNVPRGYDPTHPQAEWLKHKNWYVQSFLPDDIVKQPEAFLDLAVQNYQRMKPLNDFLNMALQGFTLDGKDRGR